MRDVHVEPGEPGDGEGASSPSGHGIGATVIAEGIHIEDEAQALRAIGVDFGQGFHLARPDVGPEPT